MKIGICYNATKSGVDTAVDNFIKQLNDYGTEYELFKDNPTKKVDYLAVFGGDGTMLRYVPYAVANDVTLLGINLGGKGFLTAYSPCNTEVLCKKLKSGLLCVKERQLICIVYGGKRYFGLNDVVLERNTSERNVSEVVKFSLKLNGVLVDDYYADGIIIATPTGSTAYSLSAGGSILTPELSAMIATPICPHSTRARPIVFSNSSVAEIDIDEESNPCSLFVDGSKITDLYGKDGFSVKTYEKSVKIVEDDEDFFTRLNSKINKWNISRD